MVNIHRRDPERIGYFAKCVVHTGRKAVYINDLLRCSEYSRSLSAYVSKGMIECCILRMS